MRTGSAKVMQKPILYYRNNLNTFLKLLDLMAIQRSVKGNSVLVNRALFMESRIVKSCTEQSSHKKSELRPTAIQSTISKK